MSTVSLIFVGLLIIYPFHDAASVESERNAYQLKSMMSTVAEVDPLKFTSYGNWCGRGGEGKAVDAIDQCCFVHDTCYDKLLVGACKESWFGSDLVVYGKTYDWKEPSESETKQAECVGGQEACETGICNCDLEFAKCISKNKGVYDEKYHGSLFGRTIGTIGNKLA